MLTTAFFKYLLMLEKGEIPPVFKVIEHRIEDDILYHKGQVPGALMLKQPVRENYAQLGFALFGAYWPQVIDGKLLLKLIKKHEKEQREIEKIEKG